MAPPLVGSPRNRPNQRRTKKDTSQRKSIVYDPVREELFKELIAQKDKEFGTLLLASIKPILIGKQLIPE
jgi:hypothetical protein